MARACIMTLKILLAAALVCRAVDLISGRHPVSV
jgi:hypothetical protein